eukprot:GHVR01171357.1.p1 GENE.GHVR01171357.1~~GHVR01171357.1.p1  ORF type:complete len:391 (+),score=21.20 GHVR01171357.1:70-1173(+)
MMISLWHVILISFAERCLFAQVPIDGYEHLYPSLLVDKIYEYTPLITSGPIIDIVTPRAQNYANAQYPNWDSTCIVVEDILLDQMIKVIDPNFEINKLAGGPTGLFKSLRSGDNKKTSQNAPAESLSPLLNYNSEGDTRVLFVVINDTEYVQQECDSSYCKLFACVTTAAPPTQPCAAPISTCLYLSTISNLHLYEGGNVVGEFTAIELYAACEVVDNTEYEIVIGDFNIYPGYQLPHMYKGDLLRLLKGSFLTISTTFGVCHSHSMSLFIYDEAYIGLIKPTSPQPPIYLRRNGVTVDTFDHGDPYFDSYVKRIDQTAPRIDGSFFLPDWYMPGRSELYYDTWYNAPDNCPTTQVPLYNYQCSIAS